MTTDTGDDTVLLFEWQVGLYVRRGLDDRHADDVRERVGQALRRWATEVQAGDAVAHLTVEE